MSWLSNIGVLAASRVSRARRIAALLLEVLLLAVRPGSWRRTVREVFSRQMLFSGVDAVYLTVFIAALVGLGVVMQGQLWLGRVGQSGLLGSLLISVVVREMAPMFVNFIVIGRSGSAMAAELATMTVRGEVTLLEAQGVEPALYLVMPRVLAVAFSVYALTVVFAFASLLSGWVFGILLGVAPPNIGAFVDSILDALLPRDIVTLVAKTIIPGFITGAVCCDAGLDLRTANATEVPMAVTSALVRSLTSAILTLVVLSVLSYV